LPYWTILTLMRKELVLSSSTSWVFRAAPFAVLSTAILSAAVLPLIGRGGAAAPLSHLAIVAGIWMLGAVFLACAGLDSASAFGGMGASREMTIAAFLEPALVVALAAFAVASGSATVDGMLSVAGAGLVARPWLLPAVAALGLVALGENARYPVDNPATHLELTMVHEAMVLEYSGPHLALMELASMVKLATFALLLANMVVPAGLLTPASGLVALAAAPAAALARLGVMMGLLAAIESSIAKLRFYSLPEYFFGALFLGLASLSLGLVAGWL
jgi:formate hydrogenlyase subunit 4